MSQAGKLAEGSPTIPGIETLTGDSGGAVAGTGVPVNVNILGTSGQITVTGNPGTSTLTLALAGGGTAIDSIAVQSTSGLGTNPVLPSATGEVSIFGTVVVAGTAPLSSISTAVNTCVLTAQMSQALAAADATKVGFSNFDSAYFTVDSTGFVSSATSKIVGYTYVDHAASSYTVLSTDYYLSCDVTAGVISILLPNAPTTGRIFVVKDKVGLCNTSNITVTTVGGAVNIDGAVTYVMNINYSAINLLFDGVAYQVW